MFSYNRNCPIILIEFIIVFLFMSLPQFPLGCFAIGGTWSSLYSQYLWPAPMAPWLKCPELTTRTVPDSLWVPMSSFSRCKMRMLLADKIQILSSKKQRVLVYTLSFLMFFILLHCQVWALSHLQRSRSCQGWPVFEALSSSAISELMPRYWSPDPLVLWSLGLLVPWSPGPWVLLIPWSLTLLTLGPLPFSSFDLPNTPYITNLK